MNLLLAQTAPVTTPPNALPSGLPVNPFEMRLLNWSGWGFEVRVGLFWLVVAIAFACLLKWLVPLLHRKVFNGFRTKSVKITFKGVDWEICPDTETRRIAYQAWVEIKSRKAGLPFEKDLDVILEVYNSWYQLFGVLRELTKSIPPDRLQDCEDTRKVVVLLIQALNDGLRPHLTRWQAKFRRWYNNELTKDANKGKSPQEIQRRYPHYDALIVDLRKVNEEFVQFADSLDIIAKRAK